MISVLLCVVLGLRPTAPLSFTSSERLVQTKTARAAAAVHMNVWQRSDADAAGKAAWLAKHPAQPWARKAQAAKAEAAESAFDGPAVSAEAPAPVEAPAPAERPTHDAPSEMPETTPWMTVQFGEESAMPGREKEFEAHKAQTAQGPGYVPPAIDSERRSRSPGLHRNFDDVSTADFKKPHGSRPAPAAPPATPATMARGTGAGSYGQTPAPVRLGSPASPSPRENVPTRSPQEFVPSRPPQEFAPTRSPQEDAKAAWLAKQAPVPWARKAASAASGMAAVGNAAEPAAEPAPSASLPTPPPSSPSPRPMASPPSTRSSVQFGAETPLPGREKEYEAFQEAVADGTAGPAYAPPPIDEDRRSRSPGLHRNFFDTPISDFKRPHGFGGAPRAPEPARPSVSSSSTRASNAGASRQPAGFGKERPLPGREKEYEAYQEAVAGGTAGLAYIPPPIDSDRRSRSPGLHRNFFDVPTSDFKRPHGFGGAPRAPEPSRAPTASSPVTARSLSAQPRSGNSAPSRPASGFGEETPLPGREKEYEVFKEAVADGTAGPAYAPAPIDADRRSRSPGLQRNFFDVPTSDFKRPHGFAGAPRAPEPPRAQGTSSPAPARASNAASSRPAPGFGEETPLPGREKEYDDYQQAVANGTAGPAYVPPPIDADRRSRSPGLHRNFFDVPTSDFKRPHGFGGAPRAPEAARPSTASPSIRSPAGNAAASRPAPGFGEETPLPGREQEYEAFQQAVADGTSGPAYVPPPIDSDRRSRSPGLHRNFFDVPTSDFKRPHGFGGAPPAPEPAQAPTAPSPSRASNAGASRQAPGFGAETPLPGREEEYEAFQKAVADGTAGPAYVPPPIDEDRRSRSPGLHRNFFDVSTSDFKRPHGFGAAPRAEAPSTVEQQQSPVESSESPASYAAEADMPSEAVDTEMMPAAAEPVELAAADETAEMLAAWESPTPWEGDAWEGDEVSQPSAEADSWVDESPMPSAEHESPDLLADTELADVSTDFDASASPAAATRDQPDVTASPERSLELLEAALSEAQAREEAARGEAAEAREREKTLAQRFEAMEKLLRKVASNAPPADAAGEENARAKEAREREEALSRRLAAVEAQLAEVKAAAAKAEESANAGTSTNSSRLSPPPSPPPPKPRSHPPQHGFAPPHGFAPFAPQPQSYGQVPLGFAPFASLPPQTLAPAGYPGLPPVPTIGASLIRELLTGLAPGMDAQVDPTTQKPVAEPYPSPLIWLRDQAHAARRPHNT